MQPYHYIAANLLLSLPSLSPLYSLTSISYLEIYNEVMYDLLSTLPESPSTRAPSSLPHTLTITEVNIQWYYLFKYTSLFNTLSPSSLFLSSPSLSPIPHLPTSPPLLLASPRPLTLVQDDRGGVTVKGLTMRLAGNEEEALNMLFEVCTCVCHCVSTNSHYYSGTGKTRNFCTPLSALSCSGSSAHVYCFPCSMPPTACLLLQGEMNRKIAEHALNTHSSRSHCIFTIHVEVSVTCFPLSQLLH